MNTAGGSDPDTGVGVGVAVNIVTATNQAIIGAGDQVTANGVTIQALQPNAGVNAFSATAMSGAGGAQNGIAVSPALNIVTDTNQALIEAAGSTPQTSVGLGTGALTMTTQDTSTNTTSATATSTGGKVGVGGSLALNIVNASSDAEVQDGVQLSDGTSAALNAGSSQTISTTTVAGASGDTAVAPSIAIAIGSSESTAYLGTVNGQAQTGSTTKNSPTVTGLNTAGFFNGMSVTGPGIPAGTTILSFTSNSVTLSKNATATGSAPLNFGLNFSGGLTVSALHSGTNTASAAGNASTTGKAGVGVALALNIVADSATASLNRNVTLTGSTAANITAQNTDSGLAQGTASASGASAGDPNNPSTPQDKPADQDVTDETTFGQSYNSPNSPEKNAAPESPDSAMNASANPSDSSDSASGKSSSEGGEGTAKVGVAAAIGVNYEKSSSIASVGNNVQLFDPSGAITVSSTNGTSAGAWALGTALSLTSKPPQNSIGAAVTLNIVLEVNDATVGDSASLQGTGITVTALQPIVQGVSQPNDVRNWSISGAGGSKVGVAGSVGINVINDSAQASFGKLDQITSTGPITVSTENDLRLRNIDGGAAFGGTAGVGVAIAVNVVTNTTTADIGPSSQVNASDALTVQATASIAPATGMLSWETQVLSAASDGTVSSLPVNPIAAAASGALSSETSVAGSATIDIFFDTTSAYIGNGAQVNTLNSGNADQDVTVEATDTTMIVAGAGGLSGSEETGIGLGLDVGVLIRQTEAYIDQSATVDAKRNITVEAQSPETITSLAAEVSAGGETGVAGAISVYVPTTTTLAYIGNGSSVSAGGNVEVTANVAETITLLAGAVGGGGENGIGASNTTLVKTDIVEAAIGLGATIVSQGPIGLLLQAILSGNMTTIAVGGAGGGEAGVAGSATVNVWNDTTHATISGGTTVNQSNSSGSVALQASDATTLLSTAGALGGGGEAGIGAGADVAQITKNTQASIGAATVTAAGNVAVQATSSENFTSLVATAGAGGSVGVAGSVGVYLFNITTRSFIGPDPLDSTTTGTTSVRAQGSVQVAANEATKDLGIAGSLSAAGSVAVGAAAVVPIVTKDTEAFIGANAHVTAMGLGGTFSADTGDFTIGSAAYGTINTNSSSTTLSANVAVPTQAKPATTINVTNATAAGFPTSGQFVIKIGNEQMLVTGGQGTNTLTVQRGYNGTTAAKHSKGDTVNEVTSTGPASSGSTTLPDDSNSLTSARLSSDRTATPATTTMTGVAVSAVNQDDIEIVGGSGGASGSVAVNISGAVNVVNNTTQAYVASGANVSANANSEAVLVAAGDDYSGLGISLGFSISGDVAATPDAAVFVVSNTTKAFIDDGATVAAHNDLTVRARNEQDILVVTVGCAGSGEGAVSLAAAVIALNDVTKAYIGNTGSSAATASAGGNMILDASDATTTFMIAGSVGIGIGTGGGARLRIVNVLKKDTEAFVGADAVIHATGGNSLSTIHDGNIDSSGNFTTLPNFVGLAVQASSSENVTSVAAAGGAGLFVGLGGGVSVELITANTLAYIGGGAMVNHPVTGFTPSSADSVNVSAVNNTTVFGFGGGLGGGAAALGGGVDVGIIDNTTSAYIGAKAKVTAQQDVNVNALSNKNVTSYGVSAAGGGVALAGSVSVWTIGAAFDANYNDGSGDSSQNSPLSGGSLSDTTNEADSQTSQIAQALQGFNASGGSPSSNLVGTDVQADAKKISSPGTGTAVSGAMSSTSPSGGTTAYIGKNATVLAGQNNAGTGNVSVLAKENIVFNATVGGISVGFAGIGGSVAIVSIESNTLAYVGSGATVRTGSAGSVNVNAALTDNVTGNAYAGQAGTIALGAQVVVINDASTEIAHVDGTVTSSSLAVTATANRALAANTIGGGLGAVAAGASIAQATAGGVTNAYLGAGETINAGSVTVSAASTDNASTDAIAVTAGIVGVAVNDSEATIDPTVTADVAAGTSTTQHATIIANSLQITATETPTSSATSTGVAVGGVGVGASISIATDDATVTAFVGDFASLSSGTLQVSATQQGVSGTNGSAYAIATGGAGGLLVGVNATSATAQATGSVSAYTGNSVLLPNGDVGITATNNTMQDAVATGVAVGGLALGADLATATSNVATSANLGPNTITNAGRSGALNISALGANQNTANSTAGGGGIIAGSLSGATTTDNSGASAGIAAGANGEPAGGGTIHAGVVTVSATNNSNYAPTVNSLQAAAFGASGAFASNTDNTSTLVTVGNNVSILATGIVAIGAHNYFTDTNSGASVQAAAGGVASGAAAESTSSLISNSSVTLGNNVTVSSGTDPVANPGGIVIVASSSLSANDQVTLTSGGALAGAGVDSSLTGNLTNAVAIGTNGNFTSDGNIGAGTYSTVNAQAISEVDTWGLAVVGSASAEMNIVSNQKVNVGATTTMIAQGNVNLTPGNDPSQMFNTVLNGNANAVGYVRGLIAVPVTSATTSLTSNTALTIASGDVIQSVQNVNIGAYAGKPNGAAVGTGNGFELGFVPLTTNGGSTPAIATSSVVTQNGTITAGVDHELSITIPDNTQSGFTSTVNVNPDGVPYTPFNPTYNSSYLPQTVVSANFSGAGAQALSAEVSTKSVSALTFGTLTVSAGNVNVNADTIQGSGTMTANGAPTISILNNSEDYLILGAIDIPNLDGGQINFTGSAGLTNAQQAGVKVNQNSSGAVPSITVNMAYNGNVGNPTTPSGPALFLTGPITNLGGSVSLSSALGSEGETSTIFAKQDTENFPNGAKVVNDQGQDYVVGQDQYAPFNTVYPGGDPASGTPSALSAVAYVANYFFNDNGQYTSADALMGSIIGFAGNSYNLSTVYVGDDLPFVEHQTSAQSAAGESPIGAAYAISGSSAQFSDGYFPELPVEALTATSNSYPTVTASQASAINAAKIVINAASIDFGGELSAGQPTNYSVNLPASLTAPLGNFVFGYPLSGGAIAYDQYLYQNGSHASPIFTIPLYDTSLISSSDTQINVTYNAQTNHITVQNVYASSVGSFVDVTGRIYSTNTQGEIHVGGGYGQVSIDNQTGLTMEVQNVYAGAAAPGSTEVDITDLNQPANTRQTAYVYVPSGPAIAEYQGPATTAVANLPFVGLDFGTSTTYSPQANLRWQWIETASLSQPASGSNDALDGAGYPEGGQWGWIFPNGSPNDPWQFVNPNTGATGETPVGQLTTGYAGEALFMETISATQQITNTQAINYNSGHFGFGTTGTYDSGSSWDYAYVTQATLTLTMSEKADNPIGVNFSGLASGSVSITSNAPVILTGDITNPNGTTTVDVTSGSITGTADASIDTANLNLTAGSGIGSSSQPLAASLASGGVLNASASSAGVNLALTSGALIGQVSADDNSGYGPVKIKATGDLNPQPGQPSTHVNVIGSTITLVSTNGGVGTTTPLVISANGRAALVYVTALNNIDLTQTAGDLQVGQIISTAGNVTLNVPNGSIFGMVALTAAPTVDPTLAADLKNSAFAQTAVANFQNQVDTDYQEYTALLLNGSVTDDDDYTTTNGTTTYDGTYTPSAAGLSLYRGQTATALGISNPTNAQITTFANGTYQALVAFFDTNLGASWRTTANFPTPPTQTLGTKAGSPTVTGLNTSGFFKGMSVSGAGIPVGATVVSFTANSVTLSANATVTGSAPLTFGQTGMTTAGSPVVMNLNTTGFFDGMAVTGPGIPAGTTVVGFTTTSATLSANASLTGSAPLTVVVPGSTQTGTTKSGNSTVTGLNTTGFFVGMSVTGKGIPASATVANFTATTMTLSANATATGSAPLTFGQGSAVKGSAVVTGLSTSGFFIGMLVTGTNIPIGTTVASFTATSVTLSANATASGPTTLTFEASPLIFAGNPSFQYTATATQMTNLTKNALWTQAELAAPVNASALSTAASIPPSNRPPSVSGVTVTLTAHNNIGNPATQMEILLTDLENGALTAAQTTAIAFATLPGEVTLEGTDGNGHTVHLLRERPPAGRRDAHLCGFLVSPCPPAPLLVAAATQLNASAVIGEAVVQSTAANLNVGAVSAGAAVILSAPGNVTGNGASISAPGQQLQVSAGAGNLAGTFQATTFNVATMTGTINEAVNGNVNLDGSGSMNVVLGGATPHTGYDQLETSGAHRVVNLNNAVLNLSLSSFWPKNNESFVIVQNDDPTSSVVGTFNGLAEGASFLLDGFTYVITYTGGVNHNDVVLTINSNPCTFQTDLPTFYWPVVPGAVTYDFFLTNVTTGKSMPEIQNLTSTSLTLTAAQALTPGDQYSWYVEGVGTYYVPEQVVDVISGVPHTVTIQVKKTGIIPPMPTPSTFSVSGLVAPTLASPANLSTIAASPGYDEPTFTWTAVAGATDYTIRVLDTTSKAVVVNNVKVTGVSFTPSTLLTPGDSFTWYVGAGDIFTDIDSSLVKYSAPQTFTLAALPAPTPTSPVNLSTIAAKTAYDRPTFTWTAVPEATAYVISLTDNTTNTVLIKARSLAGSSTSFTPDQFLTPGDSFTWSIGAESVSSSGTALTTSAPQTFALAPLAAPKLTAPVNGNTIANSSGYDTPTFTWNSVPGTTSYQITVTDSTTKTVVVNPVTMSGTSYTIGATQALTPGHSYSWSVAAVSMNGKASTASAAQTFTLTALPAPTLTAPIGPIAPSSGYDTPTFVWSGIPGADHYVISLTDSTSKTVLIKAATVTGTSYALTAPLTPGHGFTWSITAVSTNGLASTVSTTQAFTLASLPAPTPTSPSGNVAASTGYDAPNFTWSSVAGANHYLLTLTDQSTKPASVSTVTVSSASYTPTTALTPGHSYTWSIAAVSGSGATTTSSPLQFTLAALSAPTPTAPVNGGTIAAAGGYDTPTFLWNSVSGAGHYVLSVSDQGTVVINNAIVTGTSFTPTTAQALTPGQSYTWSVTAVSTNGAAMTPSAAPQTFTLAALAASTPTAPANRKTIAAISGYDTPTFTWSSVLGADHYAISVSDKGAVILTNADVTGTSFTPTAAQALTPGQTYTWSVTAVSTNGKATTPNTSSPDIWAR